MHMNRIQTFELVQMHVEIITVSTSVDLFSLSIYEYMDYK